MTDERMRDLTIKPLVDGGFELWQQTGLDEADVIELHPAQIRLLAECAGLLPAPDPRLLDRLSAAHTRRLHALGDKIDQLRDCYLDEILDHCGAGVEISLYLRAISDLSDELIDDLGAAPPSTPVTENSNEKSPDISVTPEQPKRGRPAAGAALTNAERQARHREKQAEPGPAQQLTLS